MQFFGVAAAGLPFPSFPLSASEEGEQNEHPYRMMFVLFVLAFANICEHLFVLFVLFALFGVGKGPVSQDGHFGRAKMLSGDAFNPLCACLIPNASRLASQAR